MHRGRLSHVNSVKMTLLSMSSRSSVDRVPAGVREVMDSIPFGDSDFSLSHDRVMLNISSFTIDKCLRISNI